jgi:hypothetical protein
VDHRETSTRFRSAISVAIAIVTVTGALAAWRVSVAAGAAGSLDSKGLAAVLQAANNDISVSAFLNMNRTFFADYRQHIQMAELLELDADDESDPGQASAMREEALRERNLAAVARGYVDQDYAKVDPDTGQESFDDKRYLAVMRAEASAQQDLDHTAYFSQADRMRDKAQSLVGVTIALSSSLFLFTTAIATNRRGRGALAGLAALTYILAVTAAVVIETV